MNDYNPEVEEVDIEPYEGDPDFEDAPSKRTAVSGNQDELNEGEALGDDLAPAAEAPEEQEDPDA